MTNRNLLFVFLAALLAALPLTVPLAVGLGAQSLCRSPRLADRSGRARSGVRRSDLSSSATLRWGWIRWRS